MTQAVLMFVQLRVHCIVKLHHMWVLPALQLPAVGAGAVEDVALHPHPSCGADVKSWLHMLFDCPTTTAQRQRAFRVATQVFAGVDGA